MNSGHRTNQAFKSLLIPKKNWPDPIGRHAGLPAASSPVLPVDPTHARSRGWLQGRPGVATSAWGSMGSREGTGEGWLSSVSLQGGSGTCRGNRTVRPCGDKDSNCTVRPWEQRLKLHSQTMWGQRLKLHSQTMGTKTQIAQSDHVGTKNQIFQETCFSPCISPFAPHPVLVSAIPTFTPLQLDKPSTLTHTHNHTALSPHLTMTSCTQSMTSYTSGTTIFRDSTALSSTNAF